MGEVVHVQAAGGHIGSHQKLQVFETETTHGVVALGLRKVAMKRVGVVAVFDKLFGHLLSFAAGAAKDNRIDAGVKVYDTLQGRIAVARTHYIVVVGDIGRALVPFADNHFLRIFHVVVGDGADFLRHGGRKKPSMFVFGRILKNAVQLVAEAHVEHFVGFVENHRVQVAEINLSTRYYVEHTPRGGYYDFHAPCDFGELSFDTRTPVDRTDAHVLDILGKILEILGNLHAQFAGGAQDKRLHTLGIGVALLQKRKPESRRLSRARLRQGHHIGVAVQQYRQYFGLHRHRLHKPQFLYSLQNLRPQIKLLKTTHSPLFDKVIT